MKQALKSIWIIFLIATGLPALAQSGKTVQGMLRDNESRVVAGASVQLIADKDTMGTSSSIAGIFTFNNVKSERFTIRVSSLGFEPFEKSFTFLQGQDRMVIPSFELQGIANMLEEVVVDGIVTVQVKGDTVEYSTKDLKLREGSVAEDALKKLQGVEVDKDGNVTAQGESVTRVRINGRDFFGGDVKTATQNLPANIIEKIQIVDDYGDMANLTGNRTGDSEKVLNIQIDPRLNSGYSSTIRTGYGTSDRYQATASIFGLTNKSQLSVLGNLNNMNARLFDFNTVGGGARRGPGGRSGGGGGMFGGGSDGITRVGSIGVNARHDFNDSLKVYGSYSYGNTDNNTITTQINQYTGLNGVDNISSDQNRLETEHRFEANLEWNISARDYIKLTPQFGFSNTDVRNGSITDFFVDDILRNNQDQVENSNGDRPRYSVSGLYNRRLSDNGRNLFFNFNYDNSVTETDYNRTVDRLVYDPNNAGATPEEIYEEALREVRNKNYSTGASLNYAEPLSEFGRLELTYDYNRAKYDNINRQNGSVVGDPEAESLLVNYDYNYDYFFDSHRVGANYSFNNNKIKYSIGGAVQPTLLSGDARSLTEFEPIHRKNFNFVPIARFEYKFSSQSNISVNYSGRASEPSLTQILPFPVSTVATNTTIGNPNLDPEFQHQLRLRFRDGDFQKGKTFFATLNGSYTIDKIVSYVIREPHNTLGLVQETRYLNETDDPAYGVNGFYHYSKSLKEKTYNISFMGGLNFGQAISYISDDLDDLEGNKNILKSFGASQGAFFRYNPSENLELNIGGRYNYSLSKASYETRNNREIHSIAPTFIGSVNITPNTIFGADLSKTFNSGYGPNINENPFIINAYVEQRFFKDQRASIRLQAFDMLDQQISLNRTVSDIITDTRTNRLGRYFMFTLTYKLEKFALGNPNQQNNFPGGMRPPRM